MGVSLVGQGAEQNPLYPVVVRGITPSTSTSDTAQTFTTTRVFLPKGAYTLSIIIAGDASFGSSSSAGRLEAGFNANYTITTVEADTGRPGPVWLGNLQQPPSASLILAKDSIISTVGVFTDQTTMASMRVDFIFHPTQSPWSAYPTVTGNKTTTATTAQISGTSDVNFNGFVMGWDYDNNHPMLLIAAASSQVRSRWRKLEAVKIFRYSPSTGKWTSKDWVGGITGASGYSFPDGSGFIVPQDWAPMMFIKNNFLHNVTTTYNIQDATYNYGWIKTDLSVAGTTLTVEPGSTNNAFRTAKADMGINASANMMYYWDKRIHKVVYAGARSSSSSGGYGAPNWRSYWGQWDIATDTNDYTQINSSTADPRIAGAATDPNNLVYTTGVPDAKTGFTYALGDNGSNTYLAKWNRSGTYTGVGNFTIQRPYETSTTTTAFNSSYNSIEYMPLNDALLSKWTNISLDYTGSSPNYMLYDSSSASNNFRGVISSFGFSQYQNQYLATDAGVFSATASYVKYQAGQGVIRYSAPITIYRAPLTATVLGSILPIMGGIPTATLGNSGTNSGTW